MTFIEPKGVNFNKTQTEYQLFPEEYFTATDCHVYFNDVYMDELTGLSFALTEKVNPIYGYASNTWDYVSRGKRFVQGQFRIAFKEAGYMFTVLDHIGLMGSHKKTALSWLLNDADRNLNNGNNGIPNHYGDVLERIEDMLDRYHGDPNAKEPDTTKKEKKTLTFSWTVPMKVGETDSLDKHKGQAERYGVTTSIRQMQTWLKNNGYGWAATKFNWSKYYGGDTWYAKTSLSGSKVKVYVEDKVLGSAWVKNKIKRNSGDWYMLLRYTGSGVDTKIGSQHASSIYESQLQKRLDQYPGDLKGMWMGAPDGSVRYDGRYGRGTAEGVRLLLKLAEHNDGSNGYWVSSKTKELLEQGFVVNGKYDFATKLAVYAFQSKMIANGKLSMGAPNGIMDKATMALMTETIEVDVTVPGKSLYNPGELGESRMAYYEREVWGRPFVGLAEQVRKQESFFLRGRRREDTDELHTEPLYQEGFDIYINYGPLPQYVKAKLYKIADDVSFNTTVKAIRNVQFTDVQQVLDPNTGQAIEEIYTFIAKDLD